MWKTNMQPISPSSTNDRPHAKSAFARITLSRSKVALFATSLLVISACGDSEGSGTDQDSAVTDAPVVEETTTSVAGTVPETPTSESEPTASVAEASPETSTTIAGTTTTVEAPVDDPCPVEPNAMTQPAGRVVSFDPERLEQAEGIAVDASGNVFASQIRLGQLLKFAPGSGDYEVFGSIPSWVDDGIGFLGLAIDQRGDIYGASASTSTPGVWRFDCATGEATLLAGTDSMIFANSIVIDASGTLYVTDSASGADGDTFLGAVWRVGPDGTVEKWLEDPMLGGNADGVPGVNGIAMRDGTIYLANSAKGLLLSLDVLDDGSPGEITQIADGFFPDGIAVDIEGNLLVADPITSAIQRIAPDGTIDEIAVGADAYLDNPSSVAFGVGETELTLYVASLAHIAPLATGAGPGIAAIDVTLPGV